MTPEGISYKTYTNSASGRSSNSREVDNDERYNEDVEGDKKRRSGASNSRSRSSLDKCIYKDADSYSCRRAEHVIESNESAISSALVIEKAE